MKRFRFLLLLAVLLCAAAAVYAKSGETKTIVDDGKTIRITREGDRMKIVVETDGKKTKEITVEGNDDDDDFDFDVPRHRHSRHVIINGRPLSEILDLPMMRGRSDAWFVCPKDHAMLRVPEPKDGDSFKCPVDGTTMEKRKAPAFSVFFDHEL